MQRPRLKSSGSRNPGLGHNDPRPEAFDAAIEDFLGALR